MEEKNKNKGINWESVIPLLFVIICFVAVFGTIGVFVIPTMVIRGSSSYTHYHGEIETSSILKEDAITATIKENASNGGFGCLSPDYTILTKTNGSVEIDYDFYSKNKTLPLDYYHNSK